MLAFLRQAVRGETARRVFMTRIPRMVGNHPEAVGIAGIFGGIAVILLPLLAMLDVRDAVLDNARAISANLSSLVAANLERDQPGAHAKRPRLFSRP
jgi:hypothetical protein